MSSLRKKAMIRLLVCAIFLVAAIVFSVLLLNGTFDGGSETTADPASTSESADLTSDSTAEGGDSASEGATNPEDVGSDSESVAEPTPEPTPEATPVSFDGLTEQPTTVYAEGEQPGFTVTPDSSMNLRAGPGTDFDKVTQVPASTAVTALGTNADETWIVVQYDGQYGWLSKEFLTAN